MNIIVCDYCSEKDVAYSLNKIALSRRPNDEELSAELCDACVEDIAKHLCEKLRTNDLSILFKYKKDLKELEGKEYKDSDYSMHCLVCNTKFPIGSNCPYESLNNTSHARIHVETLKNDDEAAKGLKQLKGAKMRNLTWK